MPVCRISLDNAEAGLGGSLYLQDLWFTITIHVDKDSPRTLVISHFAFLGYQCAFQLEITKMRFWLEVIPALVFFLHCSSVSFEIMLGYNNKHLTSLACKIWPPSHFQHSSPSSSPTWAGIYVAFGKQKLGFSPK